MIPVQEYDLNNALLTLMYEWKTGMIDQTQALKEFKQCLKYYSRMEDVMFFSENILVSEEEILRFGHGLVINRNKCTLSERISAAAIEKGCISFEEIIPYDQGNIPHRRLEMKMQAIIQKTNVP